VFGEGREYLVALVQPASGPDGPASPGEVEQAIAQQGQRLPDYARVRRFRLDGEVFLPDRGFVTTTGRFRRPELYAAVADELAGLYAEPAPRVMSLEVNR
jgi:hypothetical protein